MNRSVRWIATLALTVCWSAALAGENVSLAEPVKLKFDPRFIMETVARRMNVALSPELPLPAIFVESTTPLSQFQDAMEAQWRFRPPLVSNAYAIARNEIYLSDSPGFYRRLKRTLDDSLAHEFVHYIQAKYFDEDLVHGRMRDAGGRDTAVVPGNPRAGQPRHRIPGDGHRQSRRRALRGRCRSELRRRGRRGRQPNSPVRDRIAARAGLTLTGRAGRGRRDRAPRALCHTLAQCEKSASASPARPQ